MALREVGLEFIGAGADKLFSDMRKGAKAFEDLADGAKKGADGLNTFERIAKGATERVGATITDMAASAAQAFGAFVGDSISKAGDFEAGMNRFGAVTGSALAESGESLESFKQLFLDMGAQTQFSAGQAQDAAINLAKGGLDPATIAAGGLKAALDLAAAGELDLATAAEISAKQYGVWVDSAADASEKAAFLAQSANLLAGAANASTVGVEDLAVGLANAGGSAKNAGLGFAEVVTSIALIAPSFSSASDAGTSFKTFVSRLIPSTNSAKAAMLDLGLATEDGKSKFYDAQGAFIGMEASAGLLQDALAGMSDEQRNATLQTIFGADAIRAAAKLAEEGSAGYREMAAAMMAQGTAADVAKAKQQGFNFAVESLTGSVETAQIVLGSAFLPVLTAVINNGLIPAVNAFTAFATATMEGTTWLAQGAAFIQASFIPALAGATAAGIAFALAQTGHVGIALALIIQRVGLATTAFLANAAAVALAAAPFVIVAAAVAGAVAIFTQFNAKVEDATTKLLESRTWWNESAVAIRDYGTASAEAQAQLAPYAATIEALRTHIQGEIEDLGKRMTAGMVTQAQYETEMAAINAHKDSLIIATEAYRAEEAAIINVQAAQLTATASLATITSGTTAMGEQVVLTSEKLEELTKAIQNTFNQGAAAVGSYVQSSATFLDEAGSRQEAYYTELEALVAESEAAQTVEQKAAIDVRIEQVKQSFSEQEAAAASSYAAQAEAQRAALGQQLIDYTNAQVMLGNMEAERAGQVTQALAQEYGIRQSDASVTFANMASLIDQFANDSSVSTDQVITGLRNTSEAAIDSEQKMRNLAKEYTMKIVDNLAEGEINIDEYKAALESVPEQVRVAMESNADDASGDASHYASVLNDIPTRITTSVVTSYSSVGDPPTPISGARASGGPVAANNMYMVGEKGPELFVPKGDGDIIPNNKLSFGSGTGGDSGFSKSTAPTGNDLLGSLKEAHKASENAIKKKEKKSRDDIEHQEEVMQESIAVEQSKLETAIENKAAYVMSVLPNIDTMTDITEGTILDTMAKAYDLRIKTLGKEKEKALDDIEKLEKDTQERIKEERAALESQLGETDSDAQIIAIKAKMDLLDEEEANVEQKYEDMGEVVKEAYDKQNNAIKEAYDTRKKFLEDALKAEENAIKQSSVEVANYVKVLVAMSKAAGDIEKKYTNAFANIAKKAHETSTDSQKSMLTLTEELAEESQELSEKWAEPLEKVSNKLERLEAARAAATSQRVKDILDARIGAIKTEQQAVLDQRNEEAALLAEAQAEKIKVAQADAKAKQDAIASELALSKEQQKQEIAELGRKQAMETELRKQALGRQLIDYTNAQVALGKLDANKARELTEGIGQRFGIDKTPDQLAAEAFQNALAGGLSSTFDVYALLDQVGSQVSGAAAIEDARRKEVERIEAMLGKQLGDGSINYDDYVRKLGKVYALADKLTYVGQLQDSAIAGLATGGPAKANTPYVVGEEGPELFVPKTSGSVVPNELFNMLMQKMQGISPSITPSQVQNYYYDNRSTVNNAYNLNVRSEQPSEGIARDFWIMKAGV